MKQSSRIMYVALLALVSLLLVYIVSNTSLITNSAILETDTGKALPPELEGEPDVFMENATITQFTANGDPKYKLYSEQLRHFESQHLTRMAKPRMTLFAKRENNTVENIEPPWIIQSKHGYVRQRAGEASPAPNQSLSIAGDHRVDNAGEIVFLREDVKLSRESTPGTGMVLSTQTLYVYPHRQFAETDQPVMIDSRVGRTKAAGFVGDLKTGILKLVSSQEQRVHTIVLPHQIKQKN